MFKGIGEFVRDAGEWGAASWVTAGALFAIALWEHLQDKSVAAFMFLCLTVPFFWAGGFVAWIKKKRAFETDRSLHGGPEVSLSWPTIRPASTKPTLFLENTGPIDAYEVKVSDIGINRTHCAARFSVVPKCPTNSRIQLDFVLCGDGVPPNHQDELEMVVYASQSDMKYENGVPIVDFPITVAFEEYGGAKYEAAFRFKADPYLQTVNIHRVSRKRIN